MLNPEFPKLIDEARSGSEEAQGKLFDGIHNYLLLISNQELDSKLQRKLGPSDIVQQTYVNAIDKLADFRGSTEQEFRGWLRTILLREIGRQRKSYGAAKRNQNREQEIQLNNSGLNAGAEPVDPEFTPSSNAVVEEQLKSLETALQNLSGDYQKVVRLRNIERLKFAEIAEILERSEDAARKLWKRAILQLNTELRDEGQE